MKDARGHGSDSRGGIGPEAKARARAAFLNYRGPTLQEAARRGAAFGGGRGKPLPQDNLDTRRTVNDLRSRMTSTGPGHMAALMQGIKNLLGG